MKTKITLLLGMLIHCSILKSQVATEQDCFGAILLCEPIFTTADPWYGQGNYMNEVGPGTCQIQGEINSLWLKFSIFSPGDLAFTIFPVSNMDYDWALYNLTNDSCASILTNGSLLSSCNSSQYAITGISSNGVGNWNGFGPTNAFNYLLPVDSGEFYYLQINNYYGVPGGFTIDFTASTAKLFNCDSVSFASTQTSVCEKFCIDFFDESTNNPVSWDWQFPGGTPSSSSDQHPADICYDNPGTFDVTLITVNASGAGDTLTLLGYITVYPNPFAPTITQSGNVLTSSAASSYQWYFNSVAIPGATNQSITITLQGLYTVEIVDSNGCLSQASIDAYYVGMELSSIVDAIRVYPNPSDGNFIIEFLNIPKGDLITLSVTNAVGQKIQVSEEKILAVPFKKEVNLNKATSGLYFIEIKSDNILVRKKMIITK